MEMAKGMLALAPAGLLLLLLLTVFGSVHAQPRAPIGFVPAQTRPPCFSQIAIANQDCAFLPTGGVASDKIVVEMEAAGHHDEEHGHGHVHRQHTHGHRHGYGQEVSRANRDCCQRLRDVDNECVCEALINLPKFLVQRRHSYSITIAGACTFTFLCRGY